MPDESAFNQGLSNMHRSHIDYDSTADNDSRRNTPAITRGIFLKHQDTLHHDARRRSSVFIFD